MSDVGFDVGRDIVRDVDLLAAGNGQPGEDVIDNDEFAIPDLSEAGPTTPELTPLPWQPVSIATAGAEPITPPTKMGGLRYEGASKTLMSGEPGVGKSMFVMAAAVEEALAGGIVLYIDFEGVPAMLLERLQAAGLTDDELARLFYLRPQLQAEPAEIRAMVERVRPTLIIIDSYDAALAAFGKTPKAEDVRAFDALVVKPLQSTGASLLITDHVVKRTEDRGVYPIGAQDKLALADVHLGLSSVTALRRGSTGKLKIKVHKDRFGYLPRASIFELRSHEVTDALSWSITSEEHEADKPFRPTVLMEKVSRYLERAPEPVSLTRVLDEVKGNRDGKIAAVNALAAEEYATEEPGRRNARLFTSARPFREAEDAGE